VKARFIEPMLLLRTERLPDSPDLLYEINLDGYRAIAFKSAGKIHLRSRNDNDFAVRYAAIAKALQAMPDESVIDGEIVALDGDGRHHSICFRTTARPKRSSSITLST
jgi:bifunctional non-homologous end joining protein LigD